MIHMFTKKVGDLLVSGAKGAKKFVKQGKKALVALLAMFGINVGANAQSLSGTDYTAGTSALETVATQIAAYVPYVVNLCYAIAGVVAIVGAISVYIAMNNEEQDVKKILLLKIGVANKSNEIPDNLLKINQLAA